MKSPVMITTALLGTVAALQAYPFTGGGAVHSGLMDPWLCSADMDGNGRPDLLCGETNGDIYILKPNGQGGFTDRKVIPLSSYRSSNGAAADFNRDGRMDFVVYLRQPSGANPEARCGVMFQQPDGSFGTPYYLLPGGAAATNGPLTVADMDRDGRPDIVMGWNNTSASVNKGRVSWFRNLGNNSFAGPSTFFLALFDDPSALAAGDYNQDGHVDMAVADAGNDQVRIFPGPSFTGPVTVSGIADVRRLVAADADLDGRVDLFSLSGTAAGTRRLMRIMNTEAGWEPQLMASETTGPFSALTCADIDGDRRPDPVFIGKTSAQCSVKLSGPDGDYHDGTGPVLNAAMSALAFADYDGDGDEDLFATMATGVLLQKNVAPHAVWRKTLTKSESPGASGAAMLASADFNGDGQADIVSASAGDGKLRWYKVTGYGEAAAPVTIASISAISSVAVGDMDRDGDMDIICPSIPAQRVLWFANNNNGASWTANTITYPLGLPTWVRTVDFDGDGDMDVVVSTDLPGPAIYLLVNSNNGQSWSPVTLRLGGSGPFEVADIIPGGGPEVVCKDSNNTTTLIHYNPATASYKTVNLGGTGEFAKGLALGDTDGDGDIDIVTAKGNRILHIRQTGPNQWAPPVELVYFGGNPPLVVRSLQLCDFDSDGRAEIVYANRGEVKRMKLNEDGTATVLPAYVDYGSGAADYGDVLTGHFNRDAFPDVVSTAVLSGLNGELRIAMGETVQAEITGRVVIPQSTGHPGRILAGRGAAVMKVDYTSHGWQGDAPSRPNRVDIQFRRADNSALLTPLEMISLMERVVLVRDAVNPGIYDPTGDTVVQNWTIFPNGGHLMFTAQTTPTIPAGEDAGFFIVATPQDDAASAPVKDVKVTLPAIFDYYPSNDTNAVTTGTTPDAVYLRLARGSYVASLSLGAPTPIQLWRLSHWGDPSDQGPGANNADPDRDGIPNLIEYACNSFPTTAEPDGGAAFMMRRPVRINGVSYLDFAIGTRPDVRIAVQYSSSPGTYWNTLSQREGNGAWSVPAAIYPGATVGTRTWFSGRHETGSLRQYYRLSVTEIPVP